MSELGETQVQVGTDEKLVDLVSEVLVDPGLHTDLRMRLCRDITGLLDTAHGDATASSPAVGGAHEGAIEAHRDGVSRMLAAVLVDPNLHTDLRMRIYREIPEMVRAAYATAPAATAPAGQPEAGQPGSIR